MEVNLEFRSHSLCTIISSPLRVTDPPFKLACCELLRGKYSAAGDRSPTAVRLRQSDRSRLSRRSHGQEGHPPWHLSLHTLMVKPSDRLLLAAPAEVV